MIRSGRHWAVIADIRKCFDTIDHEIILRLLGEVIADGDLLQLIRHWLAADIIDFGDVIPSELGVAQGEAISPLLANIYLNPIDKELERSGFTFVRYADDFVILCDTEAQAQSRLRLMGEFLQGALRMELKPAKTQYCRVDQGIRFLGFEIGVADVCIPSARIAATQRAIEVLIDTMAHGDQRTGGIYTTGERVIRIPVRSTRQGNLTMILAHELGHAETDRRGLFDSSLQGHGVDWMRVMIEAGLGAEAQRSAGFYSGGWQAFQIAQQSATGGGRSQDSAAPESDGQVPGSTYTRPTTRCVARIEYLITDNNGSRVEVKEFSACTSR